MIPLENQVTSLEPSMRLKELGVEQDSLWYWGERTYSDGKDIVSKSRLRSSAWNEICSAFTVAELGEMLPARIKTDYGSWNYLLIVKLENTKEWLIGYYHDEIKGNTLANACAKMLIYLIEHKLEEAKR